MNIIEVFQAGQIPELNEAVMREVVDGYDADTYQAPLVLGHPESNQPAYGWVKQVFTKGKRMFAEVAEVDETVTDLVRKGLYKNVSVSFYKPTAAESPQPGKWSLRHVGLLGATPPAIKGMDRLKLAELKLNETEEEILTVDMNEDEKSLVRQICKALGLANDDKTDLDDATLFRRLMDAWKKKAPGDLADRIAQMDATRKAKWILHSMADFMDMQFDDVLSLLKQDSQTDPNKEANMSEEDKAKLDALQKENAELKKAQAEAGRAAIENYAEEQAKAGKVLPKDKAALVEVLTTLSEREDGGVVSLAEGEDKIDLADWLKKQIEGQKPVIDYSERAGAGDEHRERVVQAGRMNAPDNLPVDQGRMALHQEALNLSETAKIPYEEAARRIEQRTTH